MTTQDRIAGSGPLRAIARRLPGTGWYERRIADLKQAEDAANRHISGLTETLAACQDHNADLRQHVANLEGHVDLLSPGTFSPAKFGKWNVVDTVRVLTGATTYVQVITPSTSNDMPRKRETHLFPIATTLWTEGEVGRKVDPSAAELPDIDELYRDPFVSSLSAQIVYADPWHFYEPSMRAFELCIRMVAPGGWLIVHDCLPRELAFVTAEPPAAEPAVWCGETWRAFADLVHNLPSGSRAVLIDTDFGIGLVQPSGPMGPIARPAPSFIPADLGPEEAWTWYMERLDQLMPLVTLEDWLSDPARLLFG